MTPLKRGFASVLLLLIILGSALGALIYSRNTGSESSEEVVSSPSPDPYAGWKIYKNPNYGFSISYPKEWHLVEYGDYAANFTLTDPQVQEASPSAIRVRFGRLSENFDLQTFEKIYNLKSDQTFLEPLDVRSKVTKIRNYDIETNRAVEYTIDRTFSALEGPKTEYSHIYEIAKNGAILKFSSSATTREEELRSDGIFQQMIASIQF